MNNHEFEKKEVYWSRFAGKYEQLSNYVIGIRNIEIIKNTLREQKISGRVLELGCGNGTYSKIISQTSNQLKATDFSDEMINTAKEQLKHLKNITVEKQNCFSLTYSDLSFDFIVMINLLHVIPAPLKALLESKRVLKSNGELIIISFTMEAMGVINILRMIFRYLRTFGKPPSKSQQLTLNKTRLLLENAGFVIKESKLIGLDSKAIFIRANMK